MSSSIQVVRGRSAEQPKRYESMAKYPFPEMEIGDHFVLTPDMTREKVAAAAANYKRRKGKVFSILKSKDKIVRVWRVA